MVIFVGPPGGGKSSFFDRFLGPRGYVRINQDTLRTREKCLTEAAVVIESGQSLAIGTSLRGVGLKR
jgi:bifunctional polynucleotide phosphatase/kinase